MLLAAAASTASDVAKGAALKARGGLAAPKEDFALPARDTAPAAAAAAASAA